MTIRRHGRKGFWLVTAASVALTAGLAAAATTERLVVDPHSGLAIYGFDPVAYFSDNAPMRGREEFELTLDGAVWRFRNAGDRAAFAAHPDVYAPQFGGYDPIHVAAGKAVPGHPEIWLVRGQRLYLFTDAKNRLSFTRTAQSILVDAWQRWPALRDSLAE